MDEALLLVLVRLSCRSRAAMLGARPWLLTLYMLCDMLGGDDEAGAHGLENCGDVDEVE